MNWSHDDGLDPARGCLNGLLLASLFWLTLAIILTR